MYILKPEVAKKLKENITETVTDSPKSLHKAKYIATIGDICTLKIFEQIREPDLCIIDYKTKRNKPLTVNQKKKIDSIGGNIVEVKNPAGTISENLWNSIETALKERKKTKIIVEGEEDLATLPVISMSEIGAKVIYGMPDKGMVVVDINQQTKKRVNNFLKRMLVK